MNETRGSAEPLRVEGIDAVDIAPGLSYLEQTGLNTYFTPSAVDDNSEERGLRGCNTDLYDLIKKLRLSENKFFIIRLLKRGDIISLLYFLDKTQLVQAMKLFPREKLIHFIHHLPKETIIKMLLWMIPLRALLQFFPMETLFNILRSKRLDVTSLVNGFDNIPEETLQKLMANITGQNVAGCSVRELKAMFRQLSKEQLLEGMKTMPMKHLFEFIFMEVKKDPELLMMVPRGEYMKVVSMMPKPCLVELFNLLPENLLVTYLAQLPEKYLALAATQLDDQTLAYVLIHQHADLILSLAAQAA